MTRSLTLSLADANTPSDVDFVFTKPNRPISKVFLHCSAASNPLHADVTVIREWHLKRGFSDVGYHYFLPFSGNIQMGRSVEVVPAAQEGNNTGSIAICLAGLKQSDFTFNQFDSLIRICKVINYAYLSKITFHGHREVSNKLCPVFDYKYVLNLDQAGNIGKGPIDRNIVDLFDVGLDVYLIQKRLNLWISLIPQSKPISTDGIFGNVTAMAVIDFQRFHGLEPNGIVGPETKVKLPSLYNI